MLRNPFLFSVCHFALACGFLLNSTGFAQISYPMLMSLKPVAIQAGATTECEVNSRYTMLGTTSGDCRGNWCAAAVEVVPPEMPELKPGEKPKEVTKLKVKFTATADALRQACVSFVWRHPMAQCDRSTGCRS